jgi:hypothetical protein
MQYVIANLLIQITYANHAAADVMKLIDLIDCGLEYRFPASAVWQLGPAVSPGCATGPGATVADE